MPSHPKHQTQENEKLLIILIKIHFHQSMISDHVGQKTDLLSVD